MLGQVGAEAINISSAGVSGWEGDPEEVGVTFLIDEEKNLYADTSEAQRARANCSRGISVAAEVADSQPMIADVAEMKDIAAGEDVGGN